VVPSSGKVLTGGVDANALQRPKRFFRRGAQYREGGSLTILATALIDTGSKMTTSSTRSSRHRQQRNPPRPAHLREARIPAVNINRSGTRKEELITDQGELAKMWILRKLLHPWTSSPRSSSCSTR